ncbi:4Fe-4S binding protein [Paracoccus sp. P2]|uniref:4Fe-4S binding protein n=2 Tax=Paracoccus TaxID=265 RepID=A0A1I5E4U8_PARPN|nr:4Fe-4S binding protein [Paracoccus pantotrophus]QLH16367.1 4Fe-4S binding protein [Paracoccus pantotrophus]RDD97414.1 4Fe-4S binding protein [Paracoccus pantotrophus]RKS52713.1 NosR/NirI family nitrite reductase transcriptional regulator [Paracoccus pantotrophus]RNI18947.1 4Fe-4S binding protein [Paracoccus pantotrophus]
MAMPVKFPLAPWRLLPALLALVLLILPAGAEPPAAPDAMLAQALFDAEGPVVLDRRETPAPGWRVSRDGQALGMIGSTWEIAATTGYSGKPLDVLVAVTPQGVIAGARLVRQTEPVLSLGISEAHIAAYVDGFRGVDLSQGEARGRALPDAISRATVSTGVIRDGILRSGRVLAQAQGLGGGGIDRVGYRPATWAELLAEGAFGHASISMAEAARAFADAKVAIEPSDAPFLDLYAGLIDPPTVGRNLLGARDFTAVAGALQPGQALVAVLSRGLYSPRGADWRRSGRFERIGFEQGALRIEPQDGDFVMVEKLALPDAPAFREISLFRLNIDPAAGGIDPRRPFDLVVTATRPLAAGGAGALPIRATIRLPAAYTVADAPAVPLWQEFWLKKIPGIAVVGAMLFVLALILFGQEALVRRPRLWRRVRLGFLATTLVVLGWGLNGQLSVVQVVAFLNALLSGFRWETFLIEPIIFLIWSAVALGLLFWGRGVFCGWLCPFGALQELMNAAAQRLGVRQIAVPQALHERLWVIKYTLFVAIVALSFYSMEQALILAEAEPFKTAISMRFLRAWPFVLFALAVLAGGLFIERFYCRYLCPLGAGLAIPAKLKIFDWLKRRPQCGRECRLCETKCTVGAIDPLGRINPNECVLCLRCQVVMNDPGTCPVLKRRARSAAAPTGEAP